MKRKICDNSALHSLEKYLVNCSATAVILGARTRRAKSSLSGRASCGCRRSSLQTMSVSSPDGIRYESDFARAHHCLLWNSLQRE